MKGTSMGISRRDFLRLAGAAAGAAALAACGVNPAPQATPTSSGPVKLVYQDWRTDWFPGMAQEMLAEFHDTHPNIRVFFTSDPEDLEGEMLAAFESGAAPDVFAGCCAFFPAWAQKGYTLDLKPYVAADIDQATIADWDRAQYQALFTADGRQYALPKYHGGLALYYNKDIFDGAGLSYPDGSWTFADYLDAMKKLTLRSGSKTTRWGSMLDVSWDRVQVHTNSWGGHFVNPDDPAKCEMSAKPAQDALEWLRARMWEDRVMATSLDVENNETRDAFIQQKIAMVEDGSWALKDILSRSPFRIGVAPFPAGPARRATLATTDGFAIYAGTKHPEAAWELMKFLIGKDYGRAMARANFLQPALASLVGDWAGYIRQQFPGPARDIDLEAFADGHLKGYSVTAEIFAEMLDVNQIAREAWDKILTLNQAPVGSMAQVCQQIEAIQKKSSGELAPCGCGA